MSSVSDVIEMAKKNHRTELSGNFQRYRCRRPIPYPKPNLEQTIFPPLAEAENPQGTQPNPYFVPLGAYQEIQKDGNVKTNIPTNVPTFPLSVYAFQNIGISVHR